jgi:hypothetical protein
LWGVPAPALDKRLAQMERVFRSPPLTKELVKAIQLISPHCKFKPNENNRAIWEMDQNGACWAEYEVLKDTLSKVEKPARILEIGPGLGRSLVFFTKKLRWDNCDLHTYEGDGETTKYTFNGPRFEDSFCGNINQLKLCLDFNGIRNVTIHNAKEIALPLLPRPFDLIYGFYTVGYHWSLEHFLSDILLLLNERSIAIFTVTADFQPFKALHQTSFKIIDQEKVWPPGERVKLIVLSR